MRIRMLLALIVLAVVLGGAVMRRVNTNGSPVLSTVALGQPISSSAMVVDAKTSRAFIIPRFAWVPNIPTGVIQTL